MDFMASVVKYTCLALLLLGLPLLTFITAIFSFNGVHLLIPFLLILFIFSGSCLYSLWRSWQSRLSGPENQPLLASQNHSMLSKFRYQKLAKGTRGFRKLIGAGTFGRVYKGTLDDGTAIAVKCLKTGLSTTFDAEVEAVLGLNHKNLVPLLGICSEGSHRILVYDFMKNSSLDRWIFSSFAYRRRRLDWKTRHSIALDTAKALLYLHEECERCVLHLDIKPENILLDGHFRAKVSDFGLAKALKREMQCCWKTLRMRGTPGYMAPEWANQFPITAKSDVFSFGIVVLEMISGRRCDEKSEGQENWHFPTVASRTARKGRFHELLDKCLELPETMEDVFRMVKVALSCVQWNPLLRPSMREVVTLLAGDVHRNPTLMEADVP